MPRIAALQDRMTKARIANNYIESKLPFFSIISVLVMKVSQEMQELMQNNDVNPLNSMKLMVVQVSFFRNGIFCIAAMKPLTLFTHLRSPFSCPFSQDLGEWLNFQWEA